jgi:hypothetical protein
MAAMVLLAATAAARAELPRARTEAGLAVTLGEAVEVSGLTPGGEVVWWTVAHEPQEYHRRVVRRGGIDQDADGDGRVVLPASGPVAIKSVWIAVDVGSGAYAVAAPEGFLPEALEFGPGEGLSGSASGQVDRLVAAREELVILTVRPGGEGAGVWAQSVLDGGEGDGDQREDGALAAVLSEAVAVGEGPSAPEALLPGDVIAVIDPRSLEVFITRLTGGGGEAVP